MGSFITPEHAAEENHVFGDTISTLATLAGTTRTGAAIQAAHFLSALAGPRAGLVTLGGEVQPIGSSMISVGGASPSQVKLTELLFGPLRFLQEDLIEQSLRVSPNLLNRLSATLADPHHSVPGQRRPVDDELLAEAEMQHAVSRAGKSTQVVSESHPVDRYTAFQRERVMTKEEQYTGATFAASSPFARIDFETVLSYNEARCLREPHVLLENPGAQVLLRGMNQVDRHSPLVLDADGHLLSGTFGRSRNNKTAEVVEGLLSGRMTHTAGGSIVSPSRGSLFSIINRDRFAELITTSELSAYLSRTLLMDTTYQEATKEGQCDVEMVKLGYDQYRKAVKDVLRVRRLDAPGVAPILGGETAERFFHAQREFQEKLEKVEVGLLPYAACFAHLPATMLWALEHLCPQQNPVALIPTALYLSEVAMRNHLDIIQQALESGKQQKLEERGETMLRKLHQHEPCRFRDLYRKFDNQKKSFHEPVLEYLIGTDRVQQSKTGLLRLTDRARGELKGVGSN